MRVTKGVRCHQGEGDRNRDTVSDESVVVLSHMMKQVVRSYSQSQLSTDLRGEEMGM